MKLPVIWAPSAIKSLEEIVAYLENKWTVKEANAFLDQAFTVIQLLREYPRMYEASRKKQYQHKAFITEQVSLIYKYRPRKKDLHLLLFWDNRRDPAKRKH